MAIELKPDIRDGMSQSERHLRSLDAGYFNIDERDATDLLQFLIHFSGQLNYYDYANKVEGDWSPFLTADIDILITLLSKQDHRSLEDEYKQLADALPAAENPAQLTQRFQALIHFLYRFTELQLGYHSRFEMAGQLHHIHHFAPDTDGLLLLLKKLDGYATQAAALLDDTVPAAPDQPYHPGEDAGDNSQEQHENPFNGGDSIGEKLLGALPHFDRIMAELNARYATLLHACRHYLQKQRPEGDVYDSHVALLMSFLHLYGYLQQPMNRLIQEHLDFYYQHIIGIKRRGETADKIHLVLEPAAFPGTCWLRKGEQLVAQVKGREQGLLYTLENDVQISGARVRELKTVYVSNRRQLKKEAIEAEDVHELQVFAASHPVPDPALFGRQAAPLEPWPLLGEEQADLPSDEKTMAETGMGLAVATPLLYAADGRREYTLRFAIQPLSLSRFENHITGLSRASGINREVLMLDVLNQSFLIHITGEQGWIAVKEYAVTSSPSNKESYIEVKWVLETGDPAVAVCNSLLHGFDPGMPWPVAKLLLNNASFHHPYTFLSYLVINRINIRLDVQESRCFQLKNNLGELYSGSPFQPFGPVPATGAYLDIKNPAIFNRYTTDLRLRLTWFDLPKEEGGFETYYAGYPFPFTNASFQVRASSPADGNARPAAADQQVFQLFETRSADGIGYLKTDTEITGINFKRIRFSNLLWPGATAAGDEQGTLHLELTEPAEGFGHKLYPQVFTETVMHNARRFVKDRPLPNPPYIPVVKSLTIDYTLTHSENINRSAGMHEEELVLMHIHPFGYDKVYPGPSTENHFFVAPFDHESNLLIGLTGLVAAQELSMLFELSEENFHHTVHEPEEIRWSHLAGNRWVPFDSAAVLQDTTGNFISSGIVTLKIPDRIEKNNTILDPGLYWLRASIPGSSSVRSKLVALFAQAAIAVRAARQTGFPAHSYRLPPGSVKGFSAKVPQIIEARQFFSSFNGQPEESYRQYNTRVSERLRHNGRLLSTTDISQAVLDAFPQVSMVKCYTADSDSSMMVPGADVHIVVVPKEREDGSLGSQEPRVNLADLYKIKQFVLRRVSDFIKVEVGNPVYEKLMVVAQVQFKTNGRQSNGYYLKQLNEDIRKYIAAWLYDPASDFGIGGGIYTSELLNYLQQRTYIDYITAFSLIHFYQVYDPTEKTFHARVTDTAVDKTAFIKGSVPGAILVPVEEHLLTVIGQPLPGKAVRAGIGEFSIGSGLLVNRPFGAAGAGEKAAPHQDDELYDITIFNQ